VLRVVCAQPSSGRHPACAACCAGRFERAASASRTHQEQGAQERGDPDQPVKLVDLEEVQELGPARRGEDLGGWWVDWMGQVNAALPAALALPLLVAPCPPTANQVQRSPVKQLQHAHDNDRALHVLAHVLEHCGAEKQQGGDELRGQARDGRGGGGIPQQELL